METTKTTRHRLALQTLLLTVAAVAGAAVAVAALAACGVPERTASDSGSTPEQKEPAPESATGAATDPPAQSGAPDRRPPGDWLVYGDTTEPTTLNCAKATERIGRQICRLVADSLIDFDQSYRFIPRLAESFEVSPDGLSIIFRLRTGVRWHDGAPFGARDVLYTIDSARRLDPKGDLFRASFGSLAEVTAPDDTTIKAVYTEPYSGALGSWRELFIMPAHRPFDPDGPSPLDRAPLGTGPFRFVRWDSQEQIVLDASKEYFGGRPLVDRYVHRIIPNAEAIRAAAEAGEVDVAGLTAEWAAENQSPDPSLPFRVIVYPASYMEMIYWNMEEPHGLFRDPRVRRALTMLLDREGYVKKIQHGFYRPATTLIDPALWGGDPALKPEPFDPEEAARLLDEAGVRDRDGDRIRDSAAGPMSFTLIYAGIMPDHREIGSLLERAAARVGVKVHLQSLEWSVMKPRVYAGQFEAAVYRWRIDPVPDPYTFFHSSQIASGYNLGGYRSQEFDRLSEELRRTIHPGRSAALLADLQRILHRDQPCTFVAIPGAIIAVHKRFRIPEVTASGLWNWYPSILRWWVPPAERKYR